MPTRIAQDPFAGFRLPGAARHSPHHPSMEGARQLDLGSRSSRHPALEVHLRIERWEEGSQQLAAQRRPELVTGARVACSGVGSVTLDRTRYSLLVRGSLDSSHSAVFGSVHSCSGQPTCEMQGFAVVTSTAGQLHAGCCRNARTFPRVSRHVRQRRCLATAAASRSRRCASNKKAVLVLIELCVQSWVRL